MFRKDKIISFIVVMLMLIAAAITVNKTIFGYRIEDKDIEMESKISDTDGAVVSMSDDVFIVHTDRMPGVINGYAGPVPLDITIKKGVITDIEAPANSETPAFFERVTPLFELWTGKTPDEALAMKVDAVSGATFSAAAVINNVRVGLAEYEGKKSQSAGSTPWKMWIALAVTLAACIFPLFVRNRIYHYVQMLANIIVLGFWCGQFLDYALILKYISTGFVFPAGLVAIVMLTAAFIYPLFGKPQHYCNHICPLGAAQQIAAQLCGYKIKISPGVLKGLDWFRKILWAVLMLMLWTDCLTGWMDLELFQAFMFESASWWIIGIAIAFVALSAIASRPYCRFICPTGSLFKRSENIG